MVVGDGIAERSEAGGEVIELAVVRGYDFAQAGDLGGEIVELAVVPRHSARDSRQQLADGSNVRPIDAAHVEIVAVVMRPGQALRVPRSPDLPCDKVC